MHPRFFAEEEGGRLEVGEKVKSKWGARRIDSDEPSRDVAVFELEGVLKVVRVVEGLGLISGMKQYGLDC